MTRLDVTDYVTGRIADLADQLTQQLQQDAIGAEWPAELASALEVSITKSEISIAYPSELAEQIEDLEYGTTKDSPKMVLRKFMNKHTMEIVNEIADASVEFLVDNEVFP